MPIVTYNGLHRHRNFPDNGGEFTRGQSVEFTTAWLDKWHNALPSDQFTVEGYEPPTEDEGQGGVPDRGWKVADIRSWLTGYGLNPKGYATKTALLRLADDALNPQKAESVIAEAAEQAEAEAATPAEVTADGEPQIEQE